MPRRVGPAALADGLTDVAGEGTDERTVLLECTVAALSAQGRAETVVDAVLTAWMPEHLGDDVALLAIRLDP